MRRPFLVWALGLMTLAGALAADPSCSRGLRGGDDVCCPKYCGKCGGNNCDERPGGYFNCCAGGVRAKRKSCSSSEPPCVMSGGGGGGGGGSAARRDVTVNLHPGKSSSSVFDKERRWGVHFDGVLFFSSVKNLEWRWIANYLNTGKGVTYVIEFTEGGWTNLRDIANGSFDWQLEKFARDAAADGRRINVRLLHEFTGDWYPWGCGRRGDNTVDAYKDAFRHVVRFFRERGCNFKYQMSYNSRPANSMLNVPWRAYYPGDDVVDMICVSAYDMSGMSKWHTKRESLAVVLKPFYDAMSFNSKPLCIGESSTTGLLGSKYEWFRQAWMDLAVRFPRIKEINWFMENKEAPWDIDGDWAAIAGFKKGFNEFKDLTRKNRALLPAPEATFTEIEKVQTPQERAAAVALEEAEAAEEARRAAMVAVRSARPLTEEELRVEEDNAALAAMEDDLAPRDGVWPPPPL